MDAVRKILEEKCIDKLEACKTLCYTSDISDNSDVVLFSRELSAEIKQCTSFEQLFGILSFHKYWNWKEYTILKGIIGISKSKEAEDELDKFEKFMGTRRGMELVSEKFTLDELLKDDKDYEIMYITIDKMYNRFTLEDFYEIQAFICKHINVRKYLFLPFIKYLLGSLHLEWYVPIQAVSHIIKMIHQNKKVLVENSIVMIKIGDKTILDVQRESLPAEKTRQVNR